MPQSILYRHQNINNKQKNKHMRGDRIAGIYSIGQILLLGRGSGVSIKELSPSIGKVFPAAVSMSSKLYAILDILVNI